MHPRYLNKEVQVYIYLNDKKGEFVERFKYDYHLPVPKLDEVIMKREKFYDVSGIGHKFECNAVLINANERK